MSESHVDALPGLAAFAAFWVGDAILLAAAWLVFQEAMGQSHTFPFAAGRSSSN